MILFLNLPQKTWLDDFWPTRWLIDWFWWIVSAHISLRLLDNKSFICNLSNESLDYKFVWVTIKHLAFEKAKPIRSNQYFDKLSLQSTSRWVDQFSTDPKPSGVLVNVRSARNPIKQFSIGREIYFLASASNSNKNNSALNNKYNIVGWPLWRQK